MMTDTPENAPGTAADGAAQGEQQAAQFAILTQYVKDLSFENPNAPASLKSGQGQPKIEVNIDIQGRKVAEDQFEVVLSVKSNAKNPEDDALLFMVELAYAGVFHIKNVPDNMLKPVLLIEAPRQLFPFARRILADSSRDGGFPPLLLDPIDFVQLYRQREAAEQQAKAQQAATNGGVEGTA